MNFKKRFKLYSELEKIRKRPIISFITSSRFGAIGLMAPDVLEPLIKLIDVLPNSTQEIDFLLESSGGDSLVAWRIISILRSKFKKVNVLISDMAFSAATILALGADSIVMGKYACLGPIDPQIIVRDKSGTAQKFAYEDVLSLLDFTKKEVGLTEQEHIRKIFSILTKSVHPLAFGFAKRASSLSVEIGEKLLLTHMGKTSDEKAKAKKIATSLNKSFFSHGHALYRKEAKAIGLNIVNATDKEEKLMREVHESFIEELESDKPFSHLAEFLSDDRAAPYLESPPPLSIPHQTNPQMVQQILVNYIQEQLSENVPDVERALKLSFLESTRRAFEFRQRFKILAFRTLDLQFKTSSVIMETGWREVPVTNLKKDKKKKKESK